MAGHVFRAEDGRLFMVRCPRCGRENYGPAVSSGECAWCGETARECHVATDWPTRDRVPTTDPELDD